MLRMFSVFDRKMKIFLTPFPARSEVDACRQIKSSFDNPDIRSTPVGQHPDDFDLVEVGSFDDESGEIISDRSVTVIANIGRLVEKSTSSTVSP